MIFVLTFQDNYLYLHRYLVIYLVKYTTKDGNKKEIGQIQDLRHEGRSQPENLPEGHQVPVSAVHSLSDEKRRDAAHQQPQC